MSVGRKFWFTKACIIVILPLWLVSWTKLYMKGIQVSLNCLQRDKMDYRRCSFLPDVFLQRVYTAIGSLSLPGTENIFGVTFRTSLVFSPERVFVCLSLYSKYSSPLAVLCNFTSPQVISRCSLQPRNPKCIVLLNQRMFSKASGVDVPYNKSFSYKTAMSSSLRA